MILVDSNLLLYAYDSSSRWHEPARMWLEEVLSGMAPVGLAWQTVLAFLRVSTHVRVFTRPLLLDEAVRTVGGWFEEPPVRLLEPTERHWSILRGLLPEAQARGPLVMDAHLAALAIEHGATLCTADRDFSRFAGLATRNPLASERR